MSDSYLTRETLLKRLKLRTDEEAWEEFVHYYQPYIYAALNRMGIADADCEDLSQKVMLKLWEALPKFDYNQKQGRFRNWLYTIVKNTTLSFITSMQVDIKQKQEIQQFSTGQKENEVEKIIEEEWEKHVAGLAFKNVSEKVTPEVMEAFQDGLKNISVEETAERLGISESSVYVYRMRVKNALVAEINNLREMLE